MAGYVHGATKKTPVAILNTFEARINQAQKILSATEQAIADKQDEARRISQELRIRRIKVGVLNHYHSPKKPFDPKAFQQEAQYAYDKAMRLHPDNAVEGPKRMAAILNEAQNVQLTIHHGRVAAPQQTHQEAA